MKKLIVTAAFAAVILLGAGCKTTSGDIFPMSIGSIWNMDIFATAETTGGTPDTSQTGTVVNTAVEKATLTSGKEVVKLKSESSIHMRMPDTTISTTSYSYAREEGDWILGYSALDDSTADTLMTTNPSVGKTWSQGTMLMVVIGQEDVTVKAGTYKNAWKLRLTTGTAGEVFYWYAKGFGMVKMHYELAILNYTTVYTQELTSATIK